MPTLRTCLAFGLMGLGLPLVAPAADSDYAGSSFNQVWNQVAADPYASVPTVEVTLAMIYDGLRDRLLDASRRTLSDRSDLLPRFQKLAHPNGVCLAGTWTITAATPWSGQFRQGTRALFIGRASTTDQYVRSDGYRSFGFAGKVFPTLDPDAVVKTGNFFTIDDLGGTLTAHYLDAVNSNDILRQTPTPKSAATSPLLASVLRAFVTADNAFFDPARVTVRQLYQVAEAGEVDPAQARTPQWLKITGAADVPRVDALDFRDELRVANYPGGLRFDLWGSDSGARGGDKVWQKIGTIAISADALSDSCDHRLHFSHPAWRN